MKSAVFGPCFMVLLTVVGSGCYMNLQGVDSEVITRLDGLEQRVAALEQGSPPPIPGAVSSQHGRVSAAEYTEDAPETEARPRSARRPVGRPRLKEAAKPMVTETDEESNPDEE